MAHHHAARLRLLALGVAVFARTAAYVAVTVVALTLLLNGNFGNYRPNALAAWLGLSAVPALLLTPFMGAPAGSRWNRVMLLAGSAVLVAVLAWARADTTVPLLSIAGVLSLEAAVSWTALIALVPGVATAARWPRAGVGVVLLVAAAAGAVLGADRGLTAQGQAGPTVDFGLVAGLLALFGVALARLTVAESQSLKRGLTGPFLTGARDTLRHRPATGALFGLGIWFFVVFAVLTAGVRLTASATDGGAARLTLRFLFALASGIAITGTNRHLYRHGGFILYAALTALVSCIWLRFGDFTTGPFIVLGVALGAMISPLLTAYQTWVSPRHDGVAAALVVGVGCVGALVVSGMLANLTPDIVEARTWLATIVLVATAIAVLSSGLIFFRPALELTAEVLIWPLYRLRAFGPGVENLPARGPCLVIGNHAAWFDPLFLAKVVPAPVTPMMTSRFYDLPVLSWIMRNIVGTIRVPEKSVRHEAPELKEAVAALDRGECVVLFPEGYLRRKEEQPIRRFGRGVWQILHDRPGTPLFACWIDGNWGSYFSYKGGPPTKNKRFDFWRRIRIAVTGPIAVDPALLADHMATRTWLMKQVAGARVPLGLEPLAVEAAADEEKE